MNLVDIRERLKVANRKPVSVEKTERVMPQTNEPLPPIVETMSKPQVSVIPRAFGVDVSVTERLALITANRDNLTIPEALKSFSLEKEIKDLYELTDMTLAAIEDESRTRAQTKLFSCRVRGCGFASHFKTTYEEHATFSHLSLSEAEREGFSTQQVQGYRPRGGF